MLNIGDIEKQRLLMTKSKRRIVFDELPQDWDSRKRVRVASLVVKKSNNAWQLYLSRYKGSTEMFFQMAQTFNDVNSKFNKTFTALTSLIESSLYLQDKVIESSKKTGISTEQIELAIETLRIAAQHPEPTINIPKKESRNPITERGEHDQMVGRLLVEQGIDVWHTSKILAKIRKRDPFTGVYSQKPKVITDVKKETRAIYDRLQRALN